jgi:hypothetical protein
VVDTIQTENGERTVALDTGKSQYLHGDGGLRGLAFSSCGNGTIIAAHEDTPDLGYDLGHVVIATKPGKA